VTTTMTTSGKRRRDDNVDVGRRVRALRRG